MTEPSPSVPKRALLIDLHTDALYEHIRGRKDITQRSEHGHLDIPRMQEGGVNGQVFAIWVSPTELQPDEYCDFALRGAQVFDRVCSGCADTLAPVRTPDAMRRAVAAGRIAALLGVEGGHALQGRLDNLDRLFAHGVRVLTLTWNNSNELADAGGDTHQPHHGLSSLGRQAIRRMNALGMIVDVSHSADRTVFDALDASLGPVIASHSGVRARRDFHRNLTDEQIRELASHGGVVGVVFLPYFLREREEDASIEDVLACIDHICQITGPDYVALGSDFDGFEARLAGLEDVTRMGAVAEGLRRLGFPAGDIAKIAGLNFLRVWDAVAATAASGRLSRQP